MKGKNVAIAGVFILAVGITAFLLSGISKQPKPIVEDFEGVIDTVTVHGDWQMEEAAPDTVQPDSVMGDSLE